MNKYSVPTHPDPAESAMLGVIVEDMLAEADKHGQAQCIFRRYRIRAHRLARSRWRLMIGDENGTLVDADIHVDA